MATGGAAYSYGGGGFKEPLAAPIATTNPVQPITQPLGVGMSGVGVAPPARDQSGISAPLPVGYNPAPPLTGPPPPMTAVAGGTNMDRGDSWNDPPPLRAKKVGRVV